MDAKNKLLDKAREKCSRPSDRALAERLGLSPAYLSAWRKGIDPMPADRVVQIASVAGVDPADWLVLIAAEQTTGATHRAWERIIQRLAIAAVLLNPVLASASPAKQGVSDRLELEAAPHALLIMRTVETVRAILCAVRRLLHGRCPIEQGTPHGTNFAWA